MREVIRRNELTMSLQNTKYEKQPKDYQVYKTQHLQQKPKDRASQNPIIIKIWVDLRSTKPNYN